VTNLTRRVEALEGDGDHVETGVRHVEAEELEAWWSEEWKPGSPTPRRGVALVPRELSLAEWVDRYGSVEIDADQPQEKPTWKP